MRQGLLWLDRREDELAQFELNSVMDHGDQNAEALRTDYNRTIADMFGLETHEYAVYACRSFDRAPRVMRSSFITGSRSGLDIAEVRKGYSLGLNEARMRINTIRKWFNEVLEDASKIPPGRVVHAFRDLDIHPEIAKAAAKLVENGHYANAVEDACKALDALVQMRSGVTNATGTKLMELVFSPNKPILKVADVSTVTGHDEQEGMMFMFKGAMLGLRNPRAHSLRTDDAERAIEYIAFLSMLAKVAENTER